MEQTDEQLLRAYSAGDFEAFDRLYSRYSGKVFSYLRKRLGSEEEAQEAFQAVFMKLHQSRSRLSPGFPVSQTLFVIARSVLLDRWRKAGKSIEALQRDAGALEHLPELRASLNPDQTHLEREEGLIHSLLEQLPPNQAEAVRLRVLDELTYSEIAKKLGRGEPSVRQLVSRGLARLREWVAARPS